MNILAATDFYDDAELHHGDEGLLGHRVETAYLLQFQGMTVFMCVPGVETMHVPRSVFHSSGLTKKGSDRMPRKPEYVAVQLLKHGSPKAGQLPSRSNVLDTQFHGWTCYCLKKIVGPQRPYLFQLKMNVGAPLF